MVAVLLLTACAGSGGKPSEPGWVTKAAYSPKIDPTKFVAVIDTPYFPLKPGTEFHYKGQADRNPPTDDMTVTSDAKVILGVTCVVVSDIVSEEGKPIEKTDDWYAQDVDGNVWYMGEDAFDLENGKFVKASDSWESG